MIILINAGLPVHGQADADRVRQEGLERHRQAEGNLCWEDEGGEAEVQERAAEDQERDGGAGNQQPTQSHIVRQQLATQYAGTICEINIVVLIGYFFFKQSAQSYIVRQQLAT